MSISAPPDISTVHAELTQQSLALLAENSTLLHYWTALLQFESVLIGPSIGTHAALCLAVQMLSSAVAASDETGSEGAAELELPVALFRDEATGLYRKPFFIADYPRYNRSGNSLIAVRVDQDQSQADGARTGEQSKAIAALIQRSIRTVDVPCRWSPTEFLILLPRTTVAEAKVVAERINRFDPGAGIPEGVLSVGITYAVPNEPFDQVFGRADWAVYSSQVSDSHEVGIG